METKKTMKKLALTFVALLFSILSYSQTIGPQVIASSGDYFTNSNLKVSWTLGEIVTETLTSSSNILTQGFQQSSYLFVSIDETNENKQISVFPNPFSDLIIVNTGNLTGLTIQVYDIEGKNLMERNIEKTNKQLDFSSFKSGIYFIKVFNKTTLLKTFKVQKTSN